MKISQRVFELLRRHEIMTDRQTQMDGQMDGQGDYCRALPTSSGGAQKITDTSHTAGTHTTILFSNNTHVQKQCKTIKNAACFHVYTFEG